MGEKGVDKGEVLGLKPNNYVKKRDKHNIFLFWKYKLAKYLFFFSSSLKTLEEDSVVLSGFILGSPTLSHDIHWVDYFV